MGGSQVALTLMGAVALMLWGVRMVHTGMLRAFGHRLRAVVGQAAANRWSAAAAGLVVTGLLQSSTATAMLVSAFVRRGLIALPLAIAMMLGADVGTTLVAQLFAADIRWLWSPAIALGVLLFKLGRTDQVKNAGRICIGLGLMLLALKSIGDVTEAMRASAPLKIVLSSTVAEPAIAVALAAVITWLAHSSLAVVLFVASLAAGNVIETRLALALVLGANIGGAFAPFVALSGSTVAARRVPLANILARSVVAILLIPLLSPIAALISTGNFSPATIPLLFHLAFNVAVAMLFLPLVDPLAVAATRLLPDPPGLPDPRQPQHLDPAVLDNPTEALGCAMRETLRVGDIVLDMLKRSLTAIEGNDMRLVKQVEKSDDTVDALHEAIKLYLISASASNLGENDARRFAEILTFNTNLEHIGDIIDRNLMELAAKKIKNQQTFSSEGLAELQRFHGRVVENMRLALNVFAMRDGDLARRLLRQKSDLRATGFDAEERHFERLRQGRTESIATSSIHIDVIRDLKRINSHLTSVAYPILEAAGELRESRLRDRGTDIESGSVSDAVPPPERSA